jgi:hypothetical protein
MKKMAARQMPGALLTRSRKVFVNLYNDHVRAIR